MTALTEPAYVAGKVVLLHHAVPVHSASTSTSSALATAGRNTEPGGSDLHSGEESLRDCLHLDSAEVQVDDAMPCSTIAYRHAAM